MGRKYSRLNFSILTYFKPLPREAARPPAPTPIGQVDNDDEGDEEEYLEPSERPSQPTVRFYVLNCKLRFSVDS